MKDPSRTTTKKTSLFRCTAAVGLFVSLSTPILWPSPAIAQESSQWTAPVNLKVLASPAIDVLPTLRWQTLTAEGAFPRKQAGELRIKQSGSIVTARLEEWPILRVGPDMQRAPMHD